MYHAILAKPNDTHVAYIFTRLNGIDIRLFPRANGERVIANSDYTKQSSDGISVRHSFAHTTFNLYEGILRFAASFTTNEPDLSRYFAVQGARDKRTEKLKSEAKNTRSRQQNYDSIDLGDDTGEYADDMYLGYHLK